MSDNWELWEDPALRGKSLQLAIRTLGRGISLHIREQALSGKSPAAKNIAYLLSQADAFEAELAGASPEAKEAVSKILALVQECNQPDIQLAIKELGQES